MYNSFVLDFRYVAPFQNKGDLKATGVKNGGQILHFLNPLFVLLAQQFMLICLRSLTAVCCVAFSLTGFLIQRCNIL